MEAEQATIRCKLKHNTMVSFWLLACLCGTLLLVHYPMVFSGFALMQGDLVDTRASNYSLEHSYLWLVGAKLHGHFWDLPSFYPQQNTAAYSSLMAGVGPFYWLWRMVGIAPDTSFQLWMLTVAVLNCLGAYLFLRGIFQIGVFSAGVAAVFFASAGSLVAHIGHPQLHCQAYVLGAFAAVIGMFRHLNAGVSERPRPAQWVNALLFFGCIVLQLYTEFYLAFFVLLTLGVTLMCSLVRREGRLWVAEVLRANVLPISVCGGLAVLLMAPWLWHYLAAMNEVGGRSLNAEVRSMIPRLQSWIDMGPHSWIYGWTAGWNMFKALPMEHEHRLGLGVVTTLACATGLWLRWRTPVVKTVIVTALLLWLLATKFIFGLPAAWELVYWVVPGGKAIRSVTRIGMLLTIPAAMGLAFLLDHLIGKKKPVFFGLASILGITCIAEQFSWKQSYDKGWMREEVAKIAREVRPDCRAFFYTESRPEVPWERVHVDAMWAGLDACKPTVNGVCANWPPGWKFYNPTSHSAYYQKMNSRLLQLWSEKHGLNQQDIQWIGQQEFSPPPPVLLPLNQEMKLHEKPGIGMLGDGWSYAETEGVWSDGAQSMITFLAPPEVKVEGQYQIVLKFRAFAPLPREEFYYTLSLNGDCLCRHHTPAGQVQGVTVEMKGAQLKPLNVLEFRFRSPRSPRETGEGGDSRLLGIFLHSIKLESTDRGVVSPPPQ